MSDALQFLYLFARISHIIGTRAREVFVEIAYRIYAPLQRKLA